MLAENTNPQKNQILYASENNNFAAEILNKEILKHTSKNKLNRFQILNTVIGKMSGIIQSPQVIQQLSLTPLVPGMSKAILIEEFNKIYISKITLPDVSKGILVFKEKENLLPFEEAKLFGHNAIHSLLGYLASLKGYVFMSEIKKDKYLLKLARDAFLNESGASLIKKYRHTGELLFTKKGYQDYADDLLERMVNPYLHDEVERVCRDPIRKLGYNDRIFGTMREALKQGIVPEIMAKGVYAALCYLKKKFKAESPELDSLLNIRSFLSKIWKHEELDEYSDQCIDLVLKVKL